jgi:hypothetical protein
MRKQHPRDFTQQATSYPICTQLVVAEGHAAIAATAIHNSLPMNFVGPT